MTRECFICGKKYIVGHPLSLHQVPKDFETKRKWLTIMGIDIHGPCDLSVYTYICAEHFVPEDFYITPCGKRCLKKGAVPQGPSAVTKGCEPGPSGQKANILQDIMNIRNLPEIVDVDLSLPEGNSENYESDKENLLSISSSEQTETATEIVLTDSTSDEPEPPPKRKRLLIRDSQDSERSSSSSTETVKEFDVACESSTTETAPEKEELSANLCNTSAKKVFSLKSRRVSRMRYFGDIKLKDVMNPRTAKKSWFIIKSTVSTLKKKVANLQQSRRRLRSKIINMNSLMSYLREQRLITENAESTIEASLPGAAGNFFRRFLKGPSRQKYDPQLRSFALTLNFYSPKAYNFVREKFNKSLPHPSTITKWYQTIDGAPGFTKEAIRALAIKVEEAKSRGGQVICNLVMDEIAIRKRVEWTGTKTVGYIDIGTDINSDNIPKAKEALVYMLVAINGHWKIPVGYFFLDGLCATERANLVQKCLTFVHESGVIVSSITCDGTASNISMCNHLGASLNAEEMKPYFLHPLTQQKIFVFLDPCHMLKLVRNCLGSQQVLTTENKTIKWEYLEKLVNLQDNEGLNAATKLKRRHLQWVREKMKVKLAAQTLSKSVSDALLFLCNDLKHEDFIGAEETANFLKLFNDFFDILNSRSRFAKYSFQRPLSPATKDTFFNFLENAAAYIKSLRLNGIPILESPRHTGFLGFLVCAESLKSFYSTYIDCGTPLLKYILTYKISQDHLEIFFSVVRSKGGFNNNPTARQFQATYKKLLIHAEIKGASTANAVALDATSILQCSSRNTLMVSQTTDDNAEDISKIINDHNYYLTYSSLNLSHYVIDIIGYMSGFVMRSVKRKISCTKCLEILEGDIAPSKLQIRKKYGKLMNASNWVNVVCQHAEQSFRFFSKTENIVSGKYRHQNINEILVTKTCQYLSPGIFDVFGDHIYDGELFDNHGVLLIRLVLKTYFDIRLYYECKKKDEDKKIRSLLTKAIIFKHQ